MVDAKKELKQGRYVLLRKLGEGAQGETFEAIDDGTAPRTGRPSPNLAAEWERYVRRERELVDAPSGGQPRRLVAIKCFRVREAKAWKDVELAEREARTLASLDHPRLPKYIEHFEEDGALYLVMEKIEGESLATLRKRKGSLGADEVTRMLTDVAEALRYLHGRAPLIVHRDIKPSNVIRRPDGSYAIVDFGAVRDRLKLGGGSTVVGTFGYMAPEQFQGRASPKSDVYGVGATAIAMLTGEEPEALPHEGLGIDVARAVQPGTPPALVRALAAMLVPDPDRRIASIDEALAFLHASPSRTEAPARMSRNEARAIRKRERAERRLARKARKPRGPFLPRLVARFGLLLALLVVWLVVGLLTPLFLVVFSLLFGSALRRAAGACVRAAKRAQGGLGRASAWLSGAEPEEARVRVAPELDRVRAVTETEAQALAIAEAEARGEDAEAWLSERLAEHVEERLAEESTPRRSRGISRS